jgi:hypothetical protein
VPFSFAFARLNALQAAVRHPHTYKTGIRCFVLNKIEEMGFIFKGNLSNKQLQHPKLPTGIEDLKDDDSDDDAEEEEHVGDVGDDENGDDGGDGEYELHGGGVSSCARSLSRICQQTNFLADNGKNVNSDSSNEGDSNDG